MIFRGSGQLKNRIQKHLGVVGWAGKRGVTCVTGVHFDLSQSGRFVA
jgi:hypothetical protein